MKLIIDRFKEYRYTYKVSYYTDSFDLIYEFGILEVHKDRVYRILNEPNKREWLREVPVFFEELKIIDLLLTKCIDNKFLLLNINNEKVKKFYDINELFKLRIKYSKYLVTLVEFGNRLF